MCLFGITNAKSSSRHFSTPINTIVSSGSRVTQSICKKTWRLLRKQLSLCNPRFQNLNSGVWKIFFGLTISLTKPVESFYLLLTCSSVGKIKLNCPVIVTTQICLDIKPLYVLKLNYLILITTHSISRRQIILCPIIEF